MLCGKVGVAADVCYLGGAVMLTIKKYVFSGLCAHSAQGGQVAIYTCVHL